MLQMKCLWLSRSIGLKFGKEKQARGWLIMACEVMVMNEMDKGERIVREEKGSPGMSTEAHEYLRKAQKRFLQIEMIEMLTWWREASGKKEK